MRKYPSFLLAVLAALAVPAVGISKTTMAGPAPKIVMAGQEHWVAGTGPQKGTYNAVLAGDPDKPGLYIVRIKIPAGTKFPAHYHNETENVTVVSGVLWAGLGDKMDASKMKAYPAGTFIQMPAKVHHFAATKVDTVIDISGMGPETMTMIEKM